MATYGTKYPVWAPFAGAEPEDTLPKYGAAKVLGQLSKVSENPEFTNAPLYGDNRLVMQVGEFSRATIDIESTIIDLETAADIYGATYAEGKLEYGAADVAPYGGFAFYTTVVDESGTQYKGVCYPKVKATPGSAEYGTKEDNITLVKDKVSFTCMAPKTGTWKIEESFATEALAKAWVDEMLPKTPPTPGV